MATNRPPKDDPAALAFSAVEDALKDSIFSMDDKPARKVESQPGKKEARREAPTANERLKAADKIAAQASTIANDDRSGASALFYGLNARPSGAPVLVAVIASLLWVVGVGAIAWVLWRLVCRGSLAHRSSRASISPPLPRLSRCRSCHAGRRLPAPHQRFAPCRVDI